MKFGIFYEHQLPRPWEDGTEDRFLGEPLVDELTVVTFGPQAEAIRVGVSGRLESTGNGSTSRATGTRSTR